MTNKYTNRELLDFNYKQSDKVNLAGQQKTAAEQALANFGEYNFNYGRQADYDKAIDAITNRKKFSYDLNGDALYQQYKDNYINQGKMAMMDTMGQAAAMTGGYGNSYAATVGNQAYQASLQNLNNVIPELYQLALESYKTEGDRLNNNLNVLGSDRQMEETSYNNKYNANLTRLTSDRDYYGKVYDSERAFDYGNQRDTVDLNNQSYWNEYETGYKAERDSIADQQWKDSYDLQAQQIRNNEKIAAYDAIVQSQKNIDSAKKKVLSKSDFMNNAKENVITRGNRGNTGNGGTTYTYNKKTYQSYEDYVFATLDGMDLSEDEMKAVLEDLL